MRVAVLLSTYNGEKYIKEQIDSILNQKGEFILDLWVRDDGSKDNTQNILQEYSESGKLNWYTGQNLGPAHSFLDLVKRCIEYDFYAFADQDDYWMPDKIEAGIRRLSNKNEASLYFANAELVDSNLRSLGRNVYKNKPKHDFYTLSCAGGLLGCTMVFNRKLAVLIQEKNMPGKIVMHDFYMAQVCVAFGGKIIFDENAYMRYRQHGGNVVGVSSGVMSTIKNRLCSITKKAKVSISSQADTLLSNYSSELDKKVVVWLEFIMNYKGKFSSRIQLAASRKTKYINTNMSLKLRLSIVLGNR